MTQGLLDAPLSRGMTLRLNETVRDITLELDTRLRLHAGGEMVLDQRHLGDEIGRRDQLRLGVAAGDDDVQPLAAGAQRGDDGAENEIFTARRGVVRVEDGDAEGGGGDELERAPPG